MFVEVLISGKTIEDSIALPRTALRTEGRVYALEGGNTLRIREVEVLRAERDRLLIRGGLEPGDQVIVSPFEEAVDGMTVRPIVRKEQP